MIDSSLRTPPVSPQHTNYRPDIDGLRALAVLSVVGFHAFPLWMPGGFVGVDVFFVISGYLISSIIYNALREQAFSYVEFYVRRIRRIFPALLTVLTICLLAGWFLLLPDEYKQLGREVWAGAGFGANLLFWSQAGYFDTSASTKPLLHLWSLGVEEQFYLLWPLAITFLYQRTRHTVLFIGALLGLSFVANLTLVGAHPSAAFYLPMTRFWELLGGALLAYWTMFVRRERTGSWGGRELSAWCGLLMLLAALLLINGSRTFPGTWALLPTLGTLCLVASQDAWLNRVVLSNRLMVLVGLISYPLYLWHWVLLAFLRIRLYEDGAEAPRSLRLLAVGLSFVLAWLTYRYIEKPIRSGIGLVSRPMGLLALLAVTALAGAAVDASDGAALRYPTEIRPLAAFHYDRALAAFADVLEGRVCSRENVRNESPSPDSAQCVETGTGQQKLIVLWGDSHAASLYAGLKTAQQGANDSFRLAHFTRGACPPVLGWTSLKEVSCNTFNDVAFERIKALKPDTVILEADWFYYLPATAENRLSPSALVATVRQLQSIGIGRIVVFGNLPVWQMLQPKVAVKIWLETHRLPERTYMHFNAGSISADAAIREAVQGTGVVFVSPMDTLCSDDGCLLTTDAKRWTPLAWDTAHLTETGSSYLITRNQASILGN